MSFPTFAVIPHVSIAVPAVGQQTITNIDTNELINYSFTPVTLWIGTPLCNIGGITYDPTSGQFRIPLSGMYEISVYLTWAPNSKGIRELIISKGTSNNNDIVIARDTRIASDVLQHMTLTTHHPLTANDTIYISAAQTSGDDLILSPMNQQGNKIVINRIC